MDPLAGALNLDDLRHLARRRLPAILYDYIAGGADDGLCPARNEAAFAALRLVPRYGVDAPVRDSGATLFGRRWSLPFGIAPTGMADLIRPGADLMLARAAARAGIPFILSGVSNATIEAVATAALDSWVQIYASRDPEVTFDMVRRAAAAGIKTLVLTIDVPAHANRERDIRAGFVRPYRPTARAAAEALLHPGWLASYLRHGVPPLANWAPYVAPAKGARAIAEAVARLHPCPWSWPLIEAVRQRFSGTLVVKGILHPGDAIRAADAGVDGIIVSNHGGRQLDRSVTPVESFLAIRAAVGGRVVLMLDSGIRRGSDVVAAFALGAAFTFVGRPTLYAVAAAGEAGAARAINILRREIGLVLAQIGCASVDQADRDLLYSPDP